MVADIELEPRRPGTLSGGAAMRSVGSAVSRIDAYDKVTGAALYAGDLTASNMLHAALVNSTHAKGRIRAIDTQPAREMPGVVAVITFDDVIAGGCIDPHYGPVVRDKPVLAAGQVRHVGEPIAVVVATTRARARDAARMVEVDIEPGDAVTSLAEAMAPDAPLVHTEGYELAGDVYPSPAPLEFGASNAAMTYRTSKGPVDEVFRDAHSVVQQRYSFPAVYHYAMEPMCVLADADSEHIGVWTSAQHPYQVQGDLARMWGRDLNRVRVVTTVLGGGFGSKSFTHVEPIAVAASIAVGRPVRLELSVTDAMAVSRRHGMEGTVRAALDAAGEIQGIDVHLDYDGGAYGLLGPYVVAKGAFRALGGYDLPAYRATTRLVYTNTSPAGSFRAIGGPQAAWATESLVEKVAAAVGRDSLALRASIVAARGAEFRPGRTPMDAQITDSLDAIAAARSRADDVHAPDDSSYWRTGTGWALGISDPGASPVSSAVVRMLSDGSVVVALGSSELGQGIRTVAAQIVAEGLHVDVASVRVLDTDTVSGPFDASTGASRSTTMSGLAAYRAAVAVAERIRRHAADMLDCPAEEITLDGGTVRTPSGATATMGAVVADAFGGRGGNFIGVGEVTKAEFPTTPAFWEISAGCARIAVDTGTGDIRVLDYTATGDLGRVVNPVTMEGQEQGAFAQGLGHALFEEMVWDAGQPVTDSLVNYRVPRVADMPTTFHSTQVENADGPGALGIKGGGEGPIMPAAPAIGNALVDACGVEITDLPLTSEKVWRALVAAGVTRSRVRTATPEGGQVNG